jgi:hypothetical protein
MNPKIPIVDLRREEIEDARRMSFKQKFLAGAELFDYACEITKSGIRMQNPAFTEDQVMAELRRRIEIGNRLETRIEVHNDLR